MLEAAEFRSKTAPASSAHSVAMGGQPQGSWKSLVVVPLGRTIVSRLLILIVCAVLSMTSDAVNPSIQGLTNLRRELVEGEHLLLTCVVNNIGSNTVIWTKIVDGRKKMLTVDKLRVIHDERIAVLHDQTPAFNSSVVIRGGDVWVLSIKNVTKKDSGGYVCRVNSSPPAQSFYIVEVKTKNSSLETKELRSTHNYTDCCMENGVDAKCLSFCSIHNILEGSTKIEPDKCENQFPSIVRCMADFRDHTNCCTEQGIPDICQDLCRGEYTVQDDFVKSHFSCNAFTEATLVCISEGIEILPMAPRSPSVEVLDPYSLRVQWQLPKPNSPKYDYFFINITTLAKFDSSSPSGKSSKEENKSTYEDIGSSVVTPKKMQIKVPANTTSYVVKKLSPVTWYELSVLSVNKFGSSMSPYRIRSLTHPVDLKKTEPIEMELPDVMGCCVSKGVKHERCLQNLCNPSKRYIEEPDMIVCAAWAQETYSCLTGNVDHTDCCRRRGIPSLCVDLCSGNVTKIDYTYFRCIDYFSDYRSCLLDGYGVLPGPPMHIEISNINPTFVFLSWSPPQKNVQSVTSYHAYYRPLSHERSCADKTLPVESGLSFLGIHVKLSPQVLENLCENTEYEVFVEAFNSHGTSDPSERIVFKTTSEKSSTALSKVYNVSECCSFVNLSPGCLPLCGYNVRMSHYKALSSTCTPEMTKVLRCMVGGRDHISCCERRGVPVSCLSLCSGAFRIQDKTSASCLPYLGNIIMCLEEGVEVLPGPVTSLHATEVVDGGMTLQWEPPVDSNVSLYQIHYQKVDKFSASHIVTFKLRNTMNVTKPVGILKDLEKGALYNVFVISMNDWGTSLPSSLLTINTTKDQESPTTLAGVPSAPHSLLLDDKSAVSLTVLWQPPLVSLPTDRIRYILHYAALSSDNKKVIYNNTITSTTATKLESLRPNTQYILFVTATNDHGDSRPSETLLAWTDPAYPAFVETPTVHPTNLIVEGGTVTILCIAMGSPPPKVSLFISGVLISEDVTRHMVTIVKNVSRSMTEVSCYADNGYGTPMQSSVSIVVSHRPSIKANEEVKVVAGSEVTVNCLVNAWPEPSMIWWKDVERRIPVINGGNVSLVIRNVTKGSYMMSLTMHEAKASTYYCHATNPLGTFTHTIKVETYTEIRQPMDISECCIRNNISDACLPSCSFDQIDFHKQMNSDQCIPEFGKLLYCGADMSDHRGCCAKKGVPPQCLDWCRSLIKSDHHEFQKCLLQWAPPIFECFHEGQGSLPGPPENVKVVSLTENSAEITWDAPKKNSEKVEMYRVFWRKKGMKLAMRNDTTATSIRIFNLTDGNDYEVAVKSGNRDGTSLLTQTKIFTHSSPYIQFHSTTGTNATATVISVILTLIFVALLAGFAWWLIRKKHLFNKNTSGISFENPSYIREQNGDAVEIAETPTENTNGIISTSMNIPLTNGGVRSPNTSTSASPPWTTQNDNNEVPGFECDLDNKGGYKRFKS